MHCSDSCLPSCVKKEKAQQMSFMTRLSSVRIKALAKYGTVGAIWAKSGRSAPLCKFDRLQAMFLIQDEFFSALSRAMHIGSMTPSARIASLSYKFSPAMFPQHQMTCSQSISERPYCVIRVFKRGRIPASIRAWTSPLPSSEAMFVRHHMASNYSCSQSSLLPCSINTGIKF